MHRLPRCTILGLAALLSQADVLIAPDTGPVHIARAMNTPVIGLYAVASPALSGPYKAQEFIVNRYPEAVHKFLGKDPEQVPWNTRVHHPGAMALIQTEDDGAGYPITPWSSIMEVLRTELPKYGGIFVQAEDELGAVSLALGFSFSGYLSVTGSAGPGISLKTEAIGWASMAEMPLIICNIQRGGPSTGLPTNVEQSDLHQAIYGGHGDSPRVVLAAATVEDCFYIAIEAARIARKYSTPVFILSDTSLATRIEAFDEPDLSKLMIDPKPDMTPRATHKPYPLDQITQHIPPGTRILDGKYPLMSGLEHDEMGHPTGSPKLHMAMTAKRRNKLRQLAEEIPVPEVYGDQKGDTLLVGWGSTYGPIHDAAKRAREHGEEIGALHLRHIHPLPNGLDKIFKNFKRIVVVEMNDQGIYGFGQLATILRARYCEPKIESVTKTDGLTYRVKEILESVFKGRTFADKKISNIGAHSSVHIDTGPENVESVKEVVPQGVG